MQLLAMIMVAIMVMMVPMMVIMMVIIMVINVSKYDQVSYLQLVDLKQYLVVKKTGN